MVFALRWSVKNKQAQVVQCDERRVAMRLPICMSVQMWSASSDGVFQGVSMDVSVSGALVETEAPFEVGSRIRLMFDEPGMRRVINGVVIRRLPNDKLAVCFDGVHRALRREVVRHMRQVLRSTPSNWSRSTSLSVDSEPRNEA